MNKSMYQPDITGHDESVYNAIMSLDDKYDNAIPVFGGALHAYKYVCGDNINIDKFISFFPDLISSAKFYKWHEDTVTTIRRFCHLCYVDTMLIEAYLGIGFEELVRL